MDIVQVENVSKKYKVKEQSGSAIKQFFFPKYKEFTAVNNLSFKVEEGDIRGFIGPNGAGKSTTIKMLVGILAPSSGSIKINGFDPYKERIDNAKQIGVVFGQRTQLWWDIPVIETFKLLRSMYRISESDYNKRIRMFSDILDLGDFINKPTRQLSLGQRMRADFGAALLHSPKVVFLDEPTIGLDVIAKEKIRDFIKTINSELGTTIILTTHDTTDIDFLCRNITVIDKGAIIYEGILDNLKKTYESSAKVTVCSSKESLRKIKENLENVDITYENENTIRIVYNPKKVDKSIILQEIMKCKDIFDIKIEQDSLENIIKNIYTGEKG